MPGVITFLFVLTNFPKYKEQNNKTIFDSIAKCVYISQC